MAKQRRGFGAIRKLPSGRYQASYVGPDAVRHVADSTFGARIDAEAWLARRREEIVDGVWSPGRHEKRHQPTVGEYAESWLAQRELKPRTVVHYRTILHRFILPEFADTRLRDVTPDMVAEWHHGLRRQTGDTYRAHAYALLRTIMRSAADEDLITASPCRVPRAGSAKRASRTEPATFEELETIVAAMPEQLRMAVEISTWVGLRFGECFELRRRDLDLRQGVVKVRRGVVRVPGKRIVGTPKSAAGVRDVAIPPHLLEPLARHVELFAAPGRDGLVFPAPNGRQWSSSSVYYYFWPARHAAGRDDLRWHDLRHSGAVLAAQAGATLAELEARFGHSTASMAMRYQHATRGRDRQIATRLSEMVQAWRDGA